MPAQTDVAATFARVLAEPVRLRAVAALADGPKTGAALAAAVETDERTLARHIRPLERLGLVAGGTGTTCERTYKLVREPVISDDAYERLPLPVRRAAAASTVTQFHASAAAAVDGGGFDRRDAHLTRTSFDLDEAGWRQAATILMDALQRLSELAEAPAERPTMRATATMLLYASEHAPAAAQRPEPRVTFSEAEGLERAIDLAESLHDAVTQEATPWAQLAALADELRVVARAAMVEQARSVPRTVNR